MAPPYHLSVRCFIIVGFDQILADLLFISSGKDAAKIPVNRFPDFALDIQAVLETADVTDDLD
ncbi:MAG: hypothetical protein AAGH90_13210 [Pseudomonadota bacterium]